MVKQQQSIMSPLNFPENKEIPDIFTMNDGTKLIKKEDWSKRKAEIRELYERYMYGPLPDTSKERVTYYIKSQQDTEAEVILDDERLHEALMKAIQNKATQNEATYEEPVQKDNIHVKSYEVEITIEKDVSKSSFRTIVTIPCSVAPSSGYPLFSEMAFLWGDAKFQPSNNCYIAAQKGYASVIWLPTEIAADNASRKGTFYTLYPYGDSYEKQTGALAAWGWGASKILDAMEQGLADELHIDWKHNILGGVSRYGKAAAVAGAYDLRIKMVVPSCSGAGGLSMYRYKSEGKTYDLSELGYQNEEGSALHTTETNEFLGCLQSADEGHWFNDAFKQFRCVEQFPMDQHFLAALSAAPDRYLFIIHSAIGEDWTNPASMSLTYVAAKQLYDFLGLSEHIKLCVHLKGHAIIPSDMLTLLAFCDLVWYEKKTQETEERLSKLGDSVYLKEPNYDAKVFDQFTK